MNCRSVGVKDANELFGEFERFYANEVAKVIAAISPRDLGPFLQICITFHRNWIQVDFRVIAAWLPRDFSLFQMSVWTPSSRNGIQVRRITRKGHFRFPIPRICISGSGWISLRLPARHVNSQNKTDRKFNFRPSGSPPPLPLPPPPCGLIAGQLIE